MIDIFEYDGHDIHAFDLSTVTGVHADQNFHYHDIGEDDLDQWDVSIVFGDRRAIRIRLKKDSIDDLLKRWKVALGVT